VFLPVSTTPANQSPTDQATKEHATAQANRRQLLLEFLVRVKHQVSLLPKAGKADDRPTDEKGRPINSLDAISKAVKMLSVELRHEYPLLTKPLEEITEAEIEHAQNTTADPFAGMVLKFPEGTGTRDQGLGTGEKKKRSKRG
jgi:hypothetical protein